MIRTVHLHGRLGKKYGRTHRFDISTPAEAVRALNANYPGFADEILALGEKGYAYRVLHGQRGDIGLNSADELNDPASGDIRIIPEIIGAKKGGIGQLILGIAMIAAVAATAGAGIWVGEAFGSTLGGMTTHMGMSLALGGVIQMLSPVPKSSQSSESTKDPSYIFNGAVNTMAQGHPVPIGYGEMIVGSAVISAGIDVDEMPITPSGNEGPTWTNPATGNVEPYPAPTLVWDYNLDNWVLPDGTELLFDSTSTSTGGSWDNPTFVETRDNYRTTDGRAPVLTAAPERWDIPNPTSFAKAVKGSNGEWLWTFYNKLTALFNATEKRFEIAARNSYGVGEGGPGGLGGSGGIGAGDASAGDGGTGGGDGSGSGGGTGTA